MKFDRGMDKMVYNRFKWLKSASGCNIFNQWPLKMKTSA